jgi:chloramphenicol-sensitive protein RarD
MSDFVTPRPNGKVGFLAAGVSFAMWGLLPLYWRLLNNHNALEIIFHRTLWSMAFLTGALAFSPSVLPQLKFLLTTPKALLNSVFTMLLLGSNWWVYIWAVNHGRVIETSLGYYLCPLVSVLLGTLFLQERLTRAQWMAVGLAAFGVLLLAFRLGSPPWLALFLAVSFALYALCKKFFAIEAGIRLWLETFLLAIVMVIYASLSDNLAFMPFFDYSFSVECLLMGAGVVTAIPTWGYAVAARNLPLSTLGFLQYFSPTIQLLLGIYIFHEPFTSTHAFSFVCIWIAIALFLVTHLLKNFRKGALT